MYVPLLTGSEAAHGTAAETPAPTLLTADRNAAGSITEF